MEDFQILESLVISLRIVCLGDAGVIVCKREEVLLISEATGRYRFHKIGVNILVGFCCSLLGCLIVLLYGFCFFAAITDIFFSIIDKNNIMMGEVFHQ